MKAIARLPLLLGFGSTLAVAASPKPNIVFILTDDQDWHMHSLHYMPLLQKHMLQEGTLFDHHYCTVSICCPSRVNLWTGLSAHNSNVTDLHPPYGGYPKFVEEGLNDAWLPVWLQQLGYNTYYVGKLFNALNVDNYNNPPVNGLKGSELLLDPYTYEYYGARMSRNAEAPVSYDGLYSTDVVAEKAYEFLEEATSHSDPFFLTIAPIGPHSEMRMVPTPYQGPPKYAARHAHLFDDYKIPRTADFNPDVASGVSWVQHLPQLNETVIEYNDEFQRSRLRALQSVDEIIEHVIETLEAKDLLDDTYIFFSTDNGFHISQHRLHPGKECPFETDIHIPLAVRGPGVPAGHVAGVVTSHTDLTPTILHLAGSERPDLDGSPIPLTLQDLAAPQSREHVNVEFWGRAIPEGKYGSLAGINARNNTYKALRVISEDYSLTYTVWCTGEREFYDVARDPGQMHNYLSKTFADSASRYSLAGRSLAHVISRLDSLLMVTKSCKGESCREPWSVLHPDGKIRTLKEALHTSFDIFYDEQPKVGFSSCPMGHLISEEGPQDVNVWADRSRFWDPQETATQQQAFNYYSDWSAWT